MRFLSATRCFSAIYGGVSRRVRQRRGKICRKAGWLFSGRWIVSRMGVCNTLTEGRSVTPREQHNYSTLCPLPANCQPAGGMMPHGIAALCLKKALRHVSFPKRIEKSRPDMTKNSINSGVKLRSCLAALKGAEPPCAMTDARAHFSPPFAWSSPSSFILK